MNKQGSRWIDLEGVGGEDGEHSRKLRNVREGSGGLWVAKRFDCRVLASR
jgi:hypothetical protein